MRVSIRFRRPKNDELSILLSFFHVEEAMKNLTLAVALLALLGTPPWHNKRARASRPERPASVAATQPSTAAV